MKDKTRLEYLDAAKGLGILLVISRPYICMESKYK